MSEPILRDVFPDWAVGYGIFDVLATLGTMPWLEDQTIETSTLDIEYFGNHSGARYCAPLVKHFMDDNGVITAAGRVTLGKIIIAKYLIPWTRLWGTMVAEYNPIHNYDMTQTRNLMKSDSSTETEEENTVFGSTNDLTYGKTETVTHGRTNDTTDYKFGFNNPSTDPQPSDSSTSTEGGTTGTSNTGTDSTEFASDNDRTVESNKVTAGEEQEELRRFGNIGVTTNQKMLTDERNLWKWIYFDQIFKDLDKVLTLAFMDPCRV